MTVELSGWQGSGDLPFSHRHPSFCAKGCTQMDLAAFCWQPTLNTARLLYLASLVLRTLMGHKANICSLDFHPYGEFVASGSQDTNIKVRHSAAHLPILSSVRDMVTSSPSLGQRTCGLGSDTSTWDPSLGKPPTFLFGAQ